MTLSNRLSKMYSELNLDSTHYLDLLQRVKDQEADESEYFDLIDYVEKKENGAEKLGAIRDFEQRLIDDIKDHIISLKELEDEYHEAAHLEDENEKDLLFEDMAKRYKQLLKLTDEVLDAIEISYFQTQNFMKYKDELYLIKQDLMHFE